MKISFVRKLVALSILLAFNTYILQAAPFEYDQQWKEVKSMEKQGKPRSALEIVENIYKKARENQHQVQMLKSLEYSIRLTGQFEEDFLIKGIEKIDREMPNFTPPASQVLHTLKADLYISYYASFRHIILDRTRVEGQASDDIKTWGQLRFTEAIFDEFKASLENPLLLQSTSSLDFSDILEKNDSLDKFRPSLFDILAHHALSFYINDEFMASRPAVRFEIDDPQMLDIAQSFVRLELKSKEAFSMKYQAMKLYKDLIAFHLNDKDPAALIDVDLSRLSFVKTQAAFEEKEKAYLHTLEQMEARFIDNSAVTEIYHKIAEYHVANSRNYKPLVSDKHQRDLIIAVQYCENASNEFPDSYGTILCRNLLKQIKQKSLSTTLEYANLPKGHILTSVAFKNVSTLYLRIIPLDPLEDQLFSRNYKTQELIDRYRRIRPDKQWSVELPAKPDFHPHRTEIAIPPLPEGYYGLMISDHPSFEGKENVRCFNNFWVTNISYITNKIDGEDRKFYVLDREKGRTISGVQVQAYEEIYDQSAREYRLLESGTFTSDEKGSFTIPIDSYLHKRLTLDLSKDDDRFITTSPFYGSKPAKPSTRENSKTYFFTDRSIYRPGQTVYFKGILLKQSGDKYEIRENATTKVRFYDANNQQLAEVELQANEFGSVNGSFAAPIGGLTGYMRIGDESGSVNIRVEEYKRPNFAINFDPIKGSYRLGSEVRVTGKAMAYSGNALDNASVKYRVVRQTYFPFRDYNWGYYPRPGVPAEITSGESETDGSGSFEILFTAVPEHNKGYQITPVFHYTLYVDITDITGETQSGIQHVQVAEKSLLIDLKMPEHVDAQAENSFDLSTTNLNGESEAVDLEINVSRLASPGKVFKDRDWGLPDLYLIAEEEFNALFPDYAYKNEADMSGWKKLDTPYQNTIRTGEGSKLEITKLKDWEPGIYSVEMAAKDAFGEDVKLTKFFTLYSGSSNKMPVEKANLFIESQAIAQPGDHVSFIIGTAYKNVQALLEVQSSKGVFKHEWITLNNELKRIDVAIEEEDRGGMAYSLSFVYNNESYNNMAEVQVPYTNKELDITFESFRDKLLPGQQEQWNIKIRSGKGEKVAAELLAGMYDASLDDLFHHQWSLNLYQKRYYPKYWDFAHAFIPVNSWLSGPPVHYEYNKPREYNHLDWENKYRWGGIQPLYKGYLNQDVAVMSMDGGEGNVRGARAGEEAESTSLADIKSDPGTLFPPPVKDRQGSMQIRKNLQETAFFFPDMKTNADGDIILSFTVPESLTRWKMMGLAYTQDLEVGHITKELITQKDLMIIPNPPRFFREGDEIWFSAKVVNMTREEIQGHATLQLFDATSMKAVDDLYGNDEIKVEFTASEGSSTYASWKLNIPENTGPVLYRIVAEAGKFSDGEEMVVPVLKNRMLVTESMPLPVNGNETKDFVFDKLANAAQGSQTLSHYSYTLEFTSNPAWYAVQALPYLMEYPYECSEQIFNRVYANAFASHIVNKQAGIKSVFERWKNETPDALLSNLQKNQDLKNVLLKETPWVMQAKDESERKKRIGLLFDLNQMDHELNSSLNKLRQRQMSNGGWAWFEGGPDNRFVTQYILTGFGKLQNLQVFDQDHPLIQSMVRDAIRYADERMFEEYERIKDMNPDFQTNKYISRYQIQYLYARSFFMEEYYLLEKHKEGFLYFKEQAKKYWLDYDRYLQGMIALSMHRLGDSPLPAMIMASIKEHALYDEEMGMYWRDEAGYYWYEAPIETQALLIEAFDEISGDEAAVELMKTWLLKQKQTQDWETTKATADACYALLLRGDNLIAEEGDVRISIGGKEFDPSQQDGLDEEAGTGYFHHRWAGSELSIDMANITITKSNDGVAWGAVYWQYFEELDKITPHESPLSIQKKLFVEINTKDGPLLEAVEDGDVLRTGDKLVSRIEIRVDRDMEFVHMKDMRAAALEPRNVLSGYRWQGGMGYYESIRDASVNFFFSYLKKGTWIFEYPLNVSQKGSFSNGISSIQCMYAPEFASHSEGIRIVVE